MKREETDLDKPIFIVTAVISILLISKIVFWVSIGTLAFGLALYIKKRADSRVAHKALLIVALSLAIMPISYFIGYRFENIEMFNVFVNAIGALLSS